MKIFENLPKEEQEKIRLSIAIQRALEQADIKYQCYYLKITEEQFWEEYLWKKVK